MNRAYIICLNPAPDQVNYLARAAGNSRFVFNWSLAEWKRQFEPGAKPSAFALKKHFNALRFFASTQRCSQCHMLHSDLTLADRIFVCVPLACSYTIDRDDNASLNLEQEARLLASPGSNSRPSSVLARTGRKTACGGEVRL